LVVSVARPVEIIMPKPGTAALESLSAVERASILCALLRDPSRTAGRAELPAEAELPAAGFLSQAVRQGLEDLERRARIGAVQAAREIGLGVLMGLYACRGEDDKDRVLTHAGMPDAVDNLGLRRSGP
jgi:hypothetical protein